MKIIHVSSYWHGAIDCPRHILARQTWSNTYKKGNWIPLPVMDQTLPRLFNEGERKLPYIKDLINEAFRVKGEFVCLTNSDICFTDILDSRIRYYLDRDTLVHANRRDFNHDFSEPIPDNEIQRGDHYPGIDLFCFSKIWWEQHRDRYPDLLSSREAFDAVLATIMSWSGSQCVPDIIYHRKHDSTWEQASNRYQLGGQLHNIYLAGEWCRKHRIDPSRFGIRDVPVPQKPMINTNECPPGLWRVSYNGITKKHYSFECLCKFMKEDLKRLGNDVPPNLGDIIKQQTLGYC